MARFGFVALVAAALLLGLLAVQPALAQGCAMCKLNAQAGGEQVARTLDYGIFILMVPTVIIFLGIFYWAFNHRDQSLREQQEEEELTGVLPLQPPAPRTSA